MDLITKYDFSQQGNFEYTPEIIASTVRINDYIYTIGGAEDLGPNGHSDVLLWVTKLTLEGAIIESKTFQFVNDHVKKAIVNSIGNIVVIGGNNNSYILEITPNLEIIKFKWTEESINDIISNDDGTYAAVLGISGSSYNEKNARIIIYDNSFEQTNFIFISTSSNNVTFSRIIREGSSYVLLGDFTSSPFIGFPNIESKGLDDIVVLKCNSTGVIEWINSFGGSRGDYLTERHDTGVRDEFIKAEQGGYYFSCTSQSSDNVFANGIGNISTYRTWIFHISSTGQLIWNTSTQAKITDIASPNKNELVYSTSSGTYNNDRMDCPNCILDVAWIGVLNASDGSFNRQAYLDGELDEIITDIEVSDQKILLFGLTESYEDPGPFFEDEDNFDGLDAIFAKYQISTNTSIVDNDNDGFTSDLDCDDNNPNVYPGATEICNGIDDNCDGQIDEGVLLTFYLDADNDGFGDINNFLEACIAPLGYVSNSSDCDDNNNQINPNANEIPANGIDEDCDGVDGSSIVYQNISLSELHTVDIDGVNINIGKKVKVFGVVSPVNFTSENYYFFLQEGNNGVLIKGSLKNYSHTKGDKIVIEGTVFQDKGMTYITPDQIFLKDNNISYNIQFSLFGSVELIENLESKYIQLSQPVRLTNTDQWNQGSSDYFDVDVINNLGTEYTIRIDKHTSLYNWEPIKQWFLVSGVVIQEDPSITYFDNYLLLPLTENDINFVGDGTCQNDEFDALMKLYHSTSGNSWNKTEGWSSAYHGEDCNYCNNWYGVFCENGKVIGIDLNDGDINTVISWTGNNLNGVVGNYIRELKNLQILNLDNNNLSETDISVFASNENLEYVTLGGCNLIGKIDFLDNWKKLRYLFLTSNNISGEIPDNISSLVDLEYLSLADNKFSGILPENLAELNNLVELYLFDNKLDGDLNLIASLNSLNYFNCSKNDFHGCFPENACNLNIFIAEGNTQLPWEGNISNFCSGNDQIGAPCKINGISGTINSSCNCVTTTSTENISLSKLKILPNPTNGIISIVNSTDSDFIIKDINGKRVIKTKNQQIDISHLPSGVYFLQTEASIHKIIKL